MKPALVRKSEVLRLLRAERNEWVAERRAFTRHSAMWHRASAAELALDTVIRMINDMEHPK